MTKIEQLKQRYENAIVAEKLYCDKIKAKEDEYSNGISNNRVLDKSVYKHPQIIENMYRTKGSIYTREVKIAHKLLVEALLEDCFGLGD